MSAMATLKEPGLLSAALGILGAIKKIERFAAVYETQRPGPPPMTRQCQTASATPIRPEMSISHTMTTATRHSSESFFQPGAGNTNTSGIGGKIGRPRKRSGMVSEYR